MGLEISEGAARETIFIDLSLNIIDFHMNLATLADIHEVKRSVHMENGYGNDSALNVAFYLVFKQLTFLPDTELLYTTSFLDTVVTPSSCKFIIQFRLFSQFSCAHFPLTHGFL